MYEVPTEVVEALESEAQKVRIRKEEEIGREKEASGGKDKPNSSSLTRKVIFLYKVGGKGGVQIPFAGGRKSFMRTISVFGQRGVRQSFGTRFPSSVCVMPSFI